VDMTYDEYLQSDTWKMLRKQRLEIDRCECVLCGKNAEHVHHRRYPNELGTETINDLVSLCSRCHKIYHEHQQRDHPEMQHCWFDDGCICIETEPGSAYVYHVFIQPPMHAKRCWLQLLRCKIWFTPIKESEFDELWDKYVTGKVPDGWMK